MKLTAKQQIAIYTAISNVFLLALTLGAFTLFVRYLLDRNLDAKLLTEAEEIVTQHIHIENARITYITSTTDQTIEQDLLTDQLSAIIVNQNGASIGKFGVFADARLHKSIDESIRADARETCRTGDYVFQKGQFIGNNAYTYLHYPVIKEGTCYGTIVIASDTRTVTEISRLTFALSVSAVAAATAFNLLIGRTIAAKILSPLHLVISRMKQVNLDSTPPELASPYAKHDEITQLIETFNRMAKRVSANANTQKSFIVDASHELKTPIARAVTDLDLIKMELKDANFDRKFIEALDQSQYELQSIAEIINTLLQATKLRQVSLILVPIQLKCIFLDELGKLEETYKELDLHVTMELSDAETVLADKQVLSLILRNCLVNACKYNKKNGTIDIIVEPVGNTYTLTIKNTTEKEDRVQEGTESYKLGFNIIRNLCAVAGYEFSADKTGGHYQVKIANLPIAIPMN